LEGIQVDMLDLYRNIKGSLFLSRSCSIALAYISGSQTCSNRYPNQDIDDVLLPSIKIFRISWRKFLLQWSLIIPRNIVILLPRYPLKNRISPQGGK